MTFQCSHPIGLQGQPEEFEVCEELKELEEQYFEELKSLEEGELL